MNYLYNAESYLDQRLNTIFHNSTLPSDSQQDSVHQPLATFNDFSWDIINSPALFGQHPIPETVATPTAALSFLSPNTGTGEYLEENHSVTSVHMLDVMTNPPIERSDDDGPQAVGVTRSEKRRVVLSALASRRAKTLTVSRTVPICRFFITHQRRL